MSRSLLPGSDDSSPSSADVSRPLSPGSDGSSAHSVDVAGPDLVCARRLIYLKGGQGEANIPKKYFPSMKFPLNEKAFVKLLQEQHVDEIDFDKKLLQKSKEMINSILKDDCSFEWIFEDDDCIILSPTNKAMKEKGFYVGLIRKCSAVNPRLKPDHAVAIFVKEEGRMARPGKTKLPLRPQKLAHGGFKATCILAVVELKAQFNSYPSSFRVDPTTRIIDEPTLTQKKFDYLTQELSYTLRLAWSGLCCCGVKRDEVPFAVIVGKRLGHNNQEQLCYVKGALIPATMCCDHFQYRIQEFDTFKKEHNAGYVPSSDAQTKAHCSQKAREMKAVQIKPQQTEEQKKAEGAILERAATAYKDTILFGFEAFLEFLSKRVAGEVPCCPLSGQKLIIQVGVAPSESANAPSKVEADDAIIVEECAKLSLEGRRLAREGLDMIERGQYMIGEGKRLLKGPEMLKKGHIIFSKSKEHGQSLITDGENLVKQGEALTSEGEDLVLKGKKIARGKQNSQVTSFTNSFVQLYPGDKADCEDSLTVLAIPASVSGHGKFISQGDLFQGKIRHETMLQLQANSAQNSGKSLWFCKPEEKQGDVNVLVKVSSPAVHPHVVKPALVWSALREVMNVSDEEPLKRNLSKVLVVVFDVTLGLVTIMRDLREEGYHELTLARKNERGEITPLYLVWKSVEDLVFGTLLPLAKLSIVHCDLRPGFDLTSNILVQDRRDESYNRFIDLILIDLESLVTLKGVEAELSQDGRYVAEGVAGNAFAYLFWQCVSLGYVWSRQLAQKDLQQENSKVLKLMVENLTTRAAGAGIADKEEYKFENFLLQDEEARKVLAKE